MGAVRKLELLSEAVDVWINGKVMLGSLTPAPSTIVAEYAGAPAGRGYDVWREDIAAIFAGSTPNQAPAARSSARSRL